MAYRFNNGVPNQIQMRSAPYENRTNLEAEMGLFVQDRWTLGNVSLTGGMRFDYLKYHYPAQPIGPATLAPFRNFTTAAKDSVNWKDITPRFGAAWDVFGNGKTAVKGNVGKYMVNADSGTSTAPANPVTGLALTTNRNWNDANGNFIPDCVLTNLQANGECGIVDNLNFGGQVPTRADDPETYNGWGKRQVQLGVLGQRPAGGDEPGGGERGLLPSHLRQLRRPGQPGHDGGRLHAVHRARAERSALAGWRRIYGRAALRSQPEQGRAGRAIS